METVSELRISNVPRVSKGTSFNKLLVTLFVLKAFSKTLLPIPATGALTLALLADISQLSVFHASQVSF